MWQRLGWGKEREKCQIRLTFLPSPLAGKGIIPQIEGLAAAIARVLDDPALAGDLRRQGLARAREFTWERVAQKTLEVYHRVEEEVQ